VYHYWNIYTCYNEQKDNNWNSWLRHSRYDKREQQGKKEESPTDQPGITSQTKGKSRKNHGIFCFIMNDLYANPNGKGGSRGTTGGGRLRDQPMVREELVVKGFKVKYLQQISFSVWDERRCDWREGENSRNLSSSSQHIGSSVQDERKYNQRETSQKEPNPRQSTLLTI